MNVDELLDQLFQSGKEFAQNAQAKGEELNHKGNKAFEDFVEEKLGFEADSDAGRATKGAAAGAALLLLLGTRGGRSLTGSALKLGSLAALGGLAYKTFQDWQTRQTDANQRGGIPVGELTGPAAQQRAEHLLAAMIAAANVDATISDTERQKLMEQLSQVQTGGDAQGYLERALEAPLSIDQLAASVDSPTFAAEMYLAAATVVDAEKPDNRLWLDELASALNVDEQLAADLRAHPNSLR